MESSVYRTHSAIFGYFSITLHLVGAVHFWFACYYDWYHAVVPMEVLPIFSAYGYKMKFLTYWDALIQSFYFTLCVADDVLRRCGNSNIETPLTKAKDFVYAAFAFPLAMFVGSTFWGLMAVDRELVLPKALDPYFPSWLNHMMHTNIVVFQLLETFTSSRCYPRRIVGAGSLLIVQACYLTWMCFVHYKSGLWVYPVFNVLNVPFRILFFVGSFLTGFVFYYIGEKINKSIWDECGNFKLNLKTFFVFKLY